MHFNSVITEKRSTILKCYTYTNLRNLFEAKTNTSVIFYSFSREKKTFLENKNFPKFYERITVISKDISNQSLQKMLIK